MRTERSLKEEHAAEVRKMEKITVKRVTLQTVVIQIHEQLQAQGQLVQTACQGQVNYGYALLGIYEVLQWYFEPD